MTGKKWIMGLVGFVVVAGLGALAYGGVGFTANVTETGTGWQNLVFGWTFEVRASSSIFVTRVGVYDDGGDGLATPHVVGIWFGSNLIRSVEVPAGAGGECIDGYRYVELVPPLELQPNPIPPGPAYTLGVLLPANNADKFIMFASDVVFGGGGTIVPWWSVNYPGCYSRETSSPALTRPLNAQLNQKGLNVNFRYATAPAPTAYAGEDRSIYTSEQAVTILAGTGFDERGDSLRYRWLKGGIELQGWMDVSVVGTANLSLRVPVPPFIAGSYTLTLEVTDGVYTASDTMTLTVSNTPPEGVPSPASQVKNDTEEVRISAQLADYDGDPLSYTWQEGDSVLRSGQASPSAGGEPISIPDLVFLPGQLVPGSHEIQLVVSDGVNASVTGVATVQIVDTTMPTLSPKPDYTMLWPPDHELHSLRILANAADNSGGPIVLTASVTSSEPADDSGDGSTEVDCYIVEPVGSATGTIWVQLRAERSGTGEGRVYTITITATDLSDNQSTATVEVRVPHDKKKK